MYLANLTDGMLLTRYVVDGDKNAFDALYRRHEKTVWSTCLRRLGGRADLAEEALQVVFVALMQEARKVRPDMIAGWLFRRAGFVASHLFREDQRRRAYEQKAAAQRQEMEPVMPQTNWNDIKPHIDSGLDSLNDNQRTTVVLHVLEGQSLGQISQSTGIHKATLQTRLESGLKKLRRFLSRRGVAVSVAALPSIIAAGSVEVAPAATLAGAHAQVMSVAMGVKSAAGAKLLAAAGQIGKIVFWVKVKMAAATAAVAIAVASTTTVVGYAVVSNGKSSVSGQNSSVARVSANQPVVNSNQQDTNSAKPPRIPPPLQIPAANDKPRPVEPRQKETVAENPPQPETQVVRNTGSAAKADSGPANNENNTVSRLPSSTPAKGITSLADGWGVRPGGGGVGAVPADTSTVSGKITKIDGDNITVGDKEYNVADAKVTLDGNEAKLADLKVDITVVLTLDKDSKVTTVAAYTKQNPWIGK